MKNLKSLIILLSLAVFFSTSMMNRAEASCCTYVTDTGGYAYDECRAATNIAPAIALSTVAIVAIIALAVQNSHDGSSSSSNHAHITGSDSSSSSSS